jgi:hypothetical protein
MNDNIHPALRPAKPKRRMEWWGYAVLGVVTIVGLGQLASPDQPTPPPSAPAAAAATTAPVSPCKSDWTKCADNSDMANNFDGMSTARYECRRQAIDMAKYGTPEFPWLFYFTAFYPGTNYSSGIVTVIETDAQFQNGFGAMVHSRVVCKYDLRTKMVIDVSVGAR